MILLFFMLAELFYTEKSHVRSLKLLDKLFYRPMLKDNYIPDEFTKSLFPNLETMTTLHGMCAHLPPLKLISYKCYLHLNATC